MSILHIICNICQWRFPTERSSNCSLISQSMGHSYSSFGVFSLSTEGWQLDPCILYDSQRGNFSSNTRVQKLLATNTSRTQLPIPPWAICKAGTQAQDSSIALRIPEEIWRLVAAGMSASEWARVSGTSRALSRVQLEALSFAPPCTAAIHWAAARWSEAKTVALTVRGWGNKETMQLSEVLHAAAIPPFGSSVFAPIQQARHMALHLEAGSSRCTHFDLWGMLGAHCTPRLQSLCLVCDRDVWLLTAPTLKHLRMEVKDQSLLYMVHVVEYFFQNLETLTICSDVHVNYQCYQDLDFAGLKSLRCVSLQMVLPRSLKVPPSCQVHFVYHNSFEASKMWDKGLGEACTSCHLVELLILEQARLSPPECLKCIVGYSCPRLAILKLNCLLIGSMRESMVIGKCLPALRELEIRTVNGLHLWVGTGLSLESLTVCSGTLLHLEMEDLDRLLSRLKRFKYAYKRCCTMTHCMVWNLNQNRRWLSMKSADGSTEMHESGATEYMGVALETGRCRDRICESCIDCLRRKHLPMSENAEWPFVGLFAQ